MFGKNDTKREPHRTLRNGKSGYNRHTAPRAGGQKKDSRMSYHKPQEKYGYYFSLKRY